MLTCAVQHCARQLFKLGWASMCGCSHHGDAQQPGGPQASVSVLVLVESSSSPRYVCSLERPFCEQFYER